MIGMKRVDVVGGADVGRKHKCIAIEWPFLKKTNWVIEPAGYCDIVTLP